MSSIARAVGELTELLQLEPGTHVCCVVDDGERSEAWTADCLAESARRGEKLFRFAPAHCLATFPVNPTIIVVDPHTAFLGSGPVDPATMYAMFRAQTAAARCEGYRRLCLVADMDWLFSAPPGRAELVSFELLLDEVVTELGATVVCAYRTEHFDPVTVAEIAAVHLRIVGTALADPGFRIWNATDAVWQVAVEIDQTNADAFGRALASVTDGRATVRLLADQLRLIAAAGIEAIIRVAAARTDLRLVIDGAGAVFQHCWRRLDLHTQLPDVQLRPASAPEPTTATPAASSPVENAA